MNKSATIGDNSEPIRALINSLLTVAYKIRIIKAIFHKYIQTGRKVVFLVGDV